MYDALLEDFEDDVTRTSEDEENFQKLPVDEMDDDQVAEAFKLLYGRREVIP